MSEVFETSDLDAAEHFLSSLYTTMRISARGRGRGMRLEQTAVAPMVRLDHITFAMSLDTAGTAPGAVIVSRVTAGTARYDSGTGERAYRSGDLFLLAQPDRPCTATTEDAEFEAAVLDPALLSLVADAAPGRSQQPVRLTGYDPVSRQAARQWTSTYAYVRDIVLASNGLTAEQPLLTGAVARLLAAVTLATFPNNAQDDPTGQDRHDSHDATLRRAVAFIDDNAHLDITVADIAAAASVSVRAVQSAFRRHLDTTPLAYLRRVRLHHARQDLLSADPARVTVTDIAYRWGFPSPSRFAAYYREVYGTSPAHTLHQD